MKSNEAGRTTEMIYGLPKKFDKYVVGRRVDPRIPDKLLKELKEYNKKLKESSGRDHFDFPEEKQN